MRQLSVYDPPSGTRVHYDTTGMRPEDAIDQARAYEEWRSSDNHRPPVFRYSRCARGCWDDEPADGGDALELMRDGERSNRAITRRQRILSGRLGGVGPALRAYICREFRMREIA